MKLVLLFFCALFIFFIVIMFSTIKLNIKRFNIVNTKGKKGTKEILAYFEIFLFGVLKIAKIKVTKERLKKLKIKRDFKQIKQDIKFARINHVLKILKKMKVKIKKANLDIKIGTESTMFTVYAVTVISSIIAIAFGRANAKKSTFSVMPMYNSGNYLKINLNCIISAKIVHIIYVIYILMKKRRIKNGGTSNRRSYDYSYE